MSYSTNLKEWGSKGSEYPDGYSQTEGEPPVDEWHNFLFYNIIKDIQHLIGEVNALDGGVSVSDDGTGVLSVAEGLDFGTYLSVTDDGDGTVTVDGAHTHDGRYVKSVEDGGTEVTSTTSKINFGSGLNVSASGGGVTVDSSGSLGGGDFAHERDNVSGNLGTSRSAGGETVSVSFNNTYAVAIPSASARVTFKEDSSNSDNKEQIGAEISQLNYNGSGEVVGMDIYVQSFGDYNLSWDVMGILA